MRNLNQDHDELMCLLNQVPGVEEHMQSFEVRMGETILQRRVELGITQTQLAEIVRELGESITQATISKVEAGDRTVGSDTYQKVLSALGGVKKLDIEFGELPKSSKRVLTHA